MKWVNDNEWEKWNAKIIMNENVMYMNLPLQSNIVLEIGKKLQKFTEQTRRYQFVVALMRIVWRR